MLLELPLPRHGGADLLPQLRASGYQGQIAFVAEGDPEQLAHAESQARSLGLALAGHLKRRVHEQDAMSLLLGLNPAGAEAGLAA